MVNINWTEVPPGSHLHADPPHEAESKSLDRSQKPSIDPL